MNKILSVNVVTFNELHEKVDCLSINNCPPAQLNSVLSLCKAGMVVEVSFVDVELPDGFRPQVNN